MEKKLLLWLLAVIGLFILGYGCQDVAAEMSYAKMLYRAKCSLCHNIIAPDRFGKEKWRLYIDKYGQTSCGNNGPYPGGQREGA